MAGYGGESGAPPSYDYPPQSGNGNALDQRRSQTQGAASQTLNVTQRVESTQVELFTASSTKAKGALSAAKSLQINNVGAATLGVVLKMNNWATETTLGTGAFGGANPIHTYLHMILPVGQTLVFPTARVVSSTGITDGGSGSLSTTLDGDSSTLSNTAPSSNMYIDTSALTTEGFADDNDTTITFDDGSGGSAENLFRVGDLIRLDDEIVRVNSIDSGVFTVDRGAHGTTKADHTNNTVIRLVFFNAYHPFTAATGGYDKVRTDNDGKFIAPNFYGYGRALTYSTTGILPGSIAIKCYSPGYQELGLSGITPSTNTGLIAGGSYWLKISIDGSTAESINFTVDANNTNFGGRNGVLSKIQDVINEKYYNTAANIFEQKASVGIVNGDVRFSSHTYLSTSAIALTAGADGASATYNIFAQQNGRFPILTKTEDAIAARLPDDTIPDGITNDAISNTSAFMYDDGNGRLVGKGKGTINYDTGAIDFTSVANAEFVVSASFGSALTGALNADYKNVISEVKVHSMNPKITGKVNLIIGG